MTPPKIRAEVFGEGSGTFCGNSAISKAILAGKFRMLYILISAKHGLIQRLLYRSKMPFLRTIPLRGVPVEVAVPTLFRGLALDEEA